MSSRSRRSSGSSSQSSHSSSYGSLQLSSQSSQHSIPSTYDITTRVGLYKCLKSRLVKCDSKDGTKFSHFSFLPLDALNDIVTETTVMSQSPGNSWLFPSIFGCKCKDISGVVKQAKKVFAILGFFEKPDLIWALFDEGLRDEHLPLARLNGDENSQILVSPRGKEFETFSKQESSSGADNFLTFQWRVLAPYFTALGEDVGVERGHRLNRDNPLPFFDVTKMPAAPGKSLVYRGTLHRAHIAPRSTKDIEVAIKDYENKDDFEKERANLMRIQKLNHPHLIRHISTIQQGKCYYVIFPWANGGNLSDFWNSPRSKDVELLLTWSLEQMLGLAGALSALHHKLDDQHPDGMNCRHGDLKPENILYFKKAGRYGTLVVADVGESKVHIAATYLRHDPTQTRATTPCYEAPEAENNTKRSRKYDMWSLGCIFLEFTIWLLDGHEAIEKFRKQRRDGDGPSAERAKFYQRNGSDPPIVHPVVTKRLQTLQKDPRCSSELVSLVKLIAQDLIVVDPSKRAGAEELRDKLGRIVDQRKRRGKNPD
ncbi:kinase-like protein [Nemania diffusa]|nr:kinase-like protein [Nemania diffusa]